jgi:hypothetical protein
MPAGKLGRLPRDPSRPVLHFENYLVPRADGLPVVPYTADVDYATKVGAENWPMYCNGPDPENASCCPGSPGGCGDCTCAFWGHAIQSWTAYNTGAMVTVPAQSIIAMYSAISGYNPQTGAGDNGCDMQTVCEYMRSTGLPDATGKVHKIAGYALLRDPQDEELLAQALTIGGTLYCGANIQQAQEDQTNAGQPWSYVEGSPVIGGHAFGLQQRRGSGDAKLIEVTWGQLQPAATSFQAGCVDEVYYVVTQDDLDANGTDRDGLNLEQLLADMALVS